MAFKDRFSLVQPWISLLVRIGMGAVMLWAGFAKVGDIPASIRSVRAYQILPETVVPFIGTMLPYLEIALGVVLVVGVFTRLSTILYVVMIGAFIFGLAWVWAKGYKIDCGCFGAKGDINPEKTNYPASMVERVSFLAMGIWLWFFPQSKFSLDRWMRG